MKLKGYRWYGHNRNKIHVRAKRGSGGVGFFIKEEVCSDYDIMRLDDSYEGILWLKLTAKFGNQELLCCVCYLPPIESTRDIDCNDFLDTLTSQIHMYCKDSQFYLCGDFNARVSNLDDYIQGIDNIKDRNVVDYKCNKYGELLCDFLINTNCCILNGRNYKNNDYTFVNTQGMSVVDYCLVPYEKLDSFQNFEIFHVSDMMNETKIVDKIGSSTCKPDHSLLMWNVILDRYETENRSEIPKVCNTTRIVYDRCSIPDNFLNTCQEDIENLIFKLENEYTTQESVDSLYLEFVDMMRTEMHSKLKHTTKRIQTGVNNKKRKLKKQWWNEQLTDLWNAMCTVEKRMIQSHGIRRCALRKEFKDKRKIFDTAVQKAKRKFLKDKQVELENLVNANQNGFWKRIGKIGIGQERKKDIPMEIVLEDGKVSNNVNTVLEKWQSAFQDLLNPIQDDNDPSQVDSLSVSNEDMELDMNASISRDEVVKAMHAMKNNKSSGIDELPAEVLKHERLVNLLRVLFEKCFNYGITPDIWKRSVISPVPKSSTSDSRDPLQYRGISLAPVTYKMYCNILNSRLTNWEEENNILHDAQNGFRKARSTVDHLSTLTSIIETRKLNRKPTFAAFIDFRKAYDAIDRTMLFSKLCDLGISGKMFQALKSIYKEVKCCVRLNNMQTDWFSVKCGLKQGCCLSPLLFNLFINDLITTISNFGIGIEVGDNDMVAILAYADDVVLLAESEDELQSLLNVLKSWCDNNKMVINTDKSMIVHFRRPSETRSSTSFSVGDVNLKTTSHYTYLGLLLTEHLDYTAMAKQVSKSANRALSLVISKYKLFGGLPFNTYTKLFDSVVWSTISYGAAIWGDRQFSCITAVQNRAERFYLGVGRYTPNAAVHGDVGWLSPFVKQWKLIINQWYRIGVMDDNRLNKKVYKWAFRANNNNRKNWCFRVSKMFQECGIENLFSEVDISVINKRYVIAKIQDKLHNDFLEKWSQDINRDTALRGNGRNKLRTYKLFKHVYRSEPYVTNILPFKHRSAFAKFRSGVAPLRLETGRYERLQPEQRTCFHCTDMIESEEHVLLVCPLYEDLREVLKNNIRSINNTFDTLSNEDKLIMILGNDNINVVKHSAKICSDILDRRRHLIFK